jgi:hypothetical protein
LALQGGEEIVSDKEIFELAEKYGDWDDFGRWTFKNDDRLLAFVEELEAKLKAAPVHAIDISQERVDETAKRKHEWVGLTEEELKTWKTVPIFEGVDPDQIRWIARKAEETLKEKNA